MPNPFAENLLNQAAPLINAREFATAAPLVDQALALDPKNRRALSLGAMIAAQTGQNALALKLINEAVRLGPNALDVIHNAATIFWWCGEPRRASLFWERQLQLQPNASEARGNLVKYYYGLKEYDLAEKHLGELVKINPNFPDVHVSLGIVAQDCGRIEEAVSRFRESMQLHPADILSANNLLFALHSHPAYGPEQIWAEHSAWGRSFEPGIPRAERHGNHPVMDRRLRVGYVSPYFRGHVVGYNLLPLFRHHDHEKFEVCCYSDSKQQDDLTGQLRGKADLWRDVAGMSDADLAALVTRDQIDVLVDLMLHSEGSRLGMFARKPAPVQVTWMGYPGSTGLTRMDYRLTDPILDPPGETDHFYSEQSIRLETFWCFEPPADGPRVGALPVERNGFVTFGCLNKFSKVNPGVLELWRQVLAAVPQSRLAMLIPKGKTHHRVREQLGIDGARLIALPRTFRREYFDYYNGVDVLLDPFPYTGHSTTLDGLWMGVPVVTLTGPTVASRGSLSILTNLGLPELVARSKEDYLALAIALAQDRPRLRELRAGLRGRMEKSILMDGARFARQAETAYRMMWQRWCEKATAS